MLNGVPHTVWPDHCVEGTADADFHSELDRSMVKKTVQKGLHPGVHSYGAFYDDGKNASSELKAKYPFLGQSTGLAEYLCAQATAAGADAIAVDVIGLALDYCVGVSAKDAATELYKGKPFTVRVIIDATRAIGDVEAARADLIAHSVGVVDSAAVLPAPASK
jgi:nicotinamidase/pyrazinamidase